MLQAHYAVLYREPQGQSGGVVIRADHADVEGGLHRLFEIVDGEPRLVYQIPVERALRIEPFPHHRAAEEFLRRSRQPLRAGNGGDGSLHLEEAGPSRTTNRSALVESRHMTINERILPGNGGRSRTD